MTTIKNPSAPAHLMRLFVVAFVAFFIFGPVLAQTEDDAPAELLPPPRLSVVKGPVQYWRPGAEGWEAAPLNTALAEGDAINAGDAATVELQVGPRDFVRLTANTMLTLVTHDPGLMQFRVDSGTASFDLRGSRSSQLMQVDAPNVSIVAGGRGYYRIFARDGETRLAVRQGGRATLNFPDGRSRSVVAGKEIAIRGGDGSRVEVFPVAPLDAWDRWNDARSEYYAASASNRYVPADVYGAADLDQYGRWREDSTYGWIWVPGVASGWAPYSTGSWQWDTAYGWTWVDTAPWGWTTNHYGRWVHVGGHWAWAPGPRGARVTYAPALVSFADSDNGVGWVALGWGEPVLPWWGRPGFRGQPWWGGWGGPRTQYREDHHYHNRDIGNAFITGRDNDFDRHRGRGATPPLMRVDPSRPGDRPNGGDSRRDHGDARPDRRPDNHPEPIFATPQRGPGVNPQYRRDPPREQSREHREIPAPQFRPATPPVSNPPHEQPRERREIPAPQFRPSTPPVSNPPHEQPRERREVPAPQFRPATPPVSNPPREQPREQRPVERERPAPRFEPRPMVVPPPQVQERPAPPQRESRGENRNQRDAQVEQPRFSPRGQEQRPQESRESPGERSGGRMRLPGDRN